MNPTVPTENAKQKNRQTNYNSWLAFLPVLPVFLGRRSNTSQICEKWKHGLNQHTLVNVGEDTALGDGDVPEKLVQLLVVADGELKVAGDNTRLLVVTGSVTGQLKDFGGEVLENGSEVDGGTGTDTLGVVALAQKTVNTANGECETSLGRTTIGERVSNGRAMEQN